ncbi:MAG: ADP-ribosylglycohydrolase family protein, partial [Candidatus Promineifilaceae bacterium]
VYGTDDRLEKVYGPKVVLAADEAGELTWTLDIEPLGPIANVGVEISSSQAAHGTLYLDYLTWDGTLNLTLKRPDHNGRMWRRAWVNGVDHDNPNFPEAFRLAHNAGVGMLLLGARDWTDYSVSSAITPHMVKSTGIAARVQGMRRYYALMLSAGGAVQLVKALDGWTVLAEKKIDWRLRGTYRLRLQVAGNRLQGWVDNQLIFDLVDVERPLVNGGIALVCEEGRSATECVEVRPCY